MVARPIQICRIQWGCSLFLFLITNTHFGQIWSKNSNGAKNNLNIQNSMVVFTFFLLDQKYPFLANLVRKIKIVSLSLNLVPRLIRVWRTECRTEFLQNCLKWNSVTRLIWICKIHKWCSIFLFSTGNTLFGQTWSKRSKLSVLSWNLVLRLIRICNSMVDNVHFFCCRPEIPVLGKFGPKT